ncbi:MAG: hypothetical protein M1834_007362 [Cirrosporium novae-zelandiae]|nr:MAG: hypothetical protein M1834_007362 [Cirrosporium novae-zelandiae]
MEYPLYNCSFVIHRLSPLYHGVKDIFDPTTLQQYASRLKHVLKGGTLRGVQVGFLGNDEGLARAGSFRDCQWKPLLSKYFWQEQQRRREGVQNESQAEDMETPEEQRRGLLIELQYEKNLYKAILLQHSSPPDVINDSHFTRFPVLLTRMPGPLCKTFLNYLSNTFDTRISVMSLSSQFMSTMLEQYLEDTSSSQSSIVFQSVVRTLQLTISFPPPISPSLKSLDITIPKEDIIGFKKAGRRLNQVERAGIGPTMGDFTTALSAYIDNTLSMSLKANNENIRISKIACGGFVIVGEGRIKLLSHTAPDSDDEDDPIHEATIKLVDLLIEKAMENLEIGVTDT